VDVITLEGEYVRALDGFRKPVLVRVTQTQPATVAVTLEGCVSSGACHRTPGSWSRTETFTLLSRSQEYFVVVAAAGRSYARCKALSVILYYGKHA
jgi:hypothetical protein